MAGATDGTSSIICISTRTYYWRIAYATEFFVGHATGTCSSCQVSIFIEGYCANCTEFLFTFLAAVVELKCFAVLYLQPLFVAVFGKKITVISCFDAELF